MRRLLLVATSLARGGAEQQVVDLGRAMRKRGWQVAVLSMTPPTDHQATLSDASIPVFSLDMRRGQAGVVDLTRYGILVRRWRPHIVHSHMVHANLLARVGRIYAPRTPVVSTVHTVMEGARWRSIAYRVTDRLANLTTAISSAAAEQSVSTRAVPCDRIVVIPNGFDFSRAEIPSGAPEGIRRELRAEHNFVWVTVGRLVPEKGHDALLDAFAAVAQDRPNAILAIAGDGPERQRLERQLQTLDLGRSVRLLGERRDVPALLAASDAFVLSSRWEGLPMVLLEAAAQALPIVSTDVGGCRDIARPELGAKLVRSEPGHIAQGMLEVMDLTGTQRRLTGSHLQGLIRDEFDMTAIADRWESIYEALIG